MNGAKLYHGRYVACRREITSGAALILTLACIVILTALVLLFLTHSLLETQVSVASADQTAASLFARGAVDSVIGELKQEIAAGSATPFSPTGSDLRDPNTVYLPTTNQAMVPYRMDAGAPANVLKRSSYNEPFYAGSFYNTTAWPAPQWAVNFSTTNPGTGSRFISMQRWNEPLLMPTAVAASTDLTPTNGFIPPDWVYVTRTAGPATAWSTALIPNTVAGLLNTNCAVGRYSYVVYDEGGLLDANAAGYPSSVSATMVRHKISEACADLTQIGLNTADINSLVTWRNPANGASATQYTNYVYSTATNAFLTPAINGGVTERLFTSRQQLIDFLTQNVANNNPSDVERMQSALPYLTTFSRELNAPSWYPQTNMAASGYSYLTVATNTPVSATNAFAPLARANTMYTNVSGIVASANQPAAVSRFPLSRLAWITLDGSLPPNVTTTQIQKSFGLVWDSANTAWIYAGPAGSTVQSSIAALSTIHGREPNFFEMLKAGILSGSVNVAPQPVFLTYPNPGDVTSRCATNAGASASPSYAEIPIPDEQTMQIGLNMIDQASTNALPSRVEFGANAGTNVHNGEDQALYGSKNLPMIYKMVNAFYHPTTTQADSPDGNAQAYFSAWAEPVFWSPYLSAVTNTAPLQIRIRADSTNAGSGYNQFYADTYNATTDDRIGGPPLPCGGPGTSTTAYTGTSGATIELDASNASTLQNATINPVLLASLLTSGAVANPPTINDIRALSPPVWTGPGCPANADLYSEPGGPTYDGFWMGLVLAPLQTTDSHHSTATPLGTFNAARFAHDNITAASRVNHQFVLEANYGSKFLEVQRMEFKYFAQSPVQVQEADLFTVANRQLDWFTFDDPRTGRFPFTFMNPTSYNVHNAVNAVTAADTSQLTYTLFPNSTDPFTGFILNTPAANSTSINILPSVNTSPTAANAGQDIFRFADNSTALFADSNPAYQDADGSQRSGDAWWSSASVNTMPMRTDAGTTQYRPIILNRPFSSVGELGYVYRDMPWRSLNFSSASSPDSGLLDYFCVNEGYAGNTNAPVVAGVLNLNTSHPQVLQAMLNGAARAELYPGTGTSGPVGYDVTPTEATTMANAITNITWNSTSPLPLLNKSEIGTRLTAANSDTSSTTTDSHIKERQETIVRALASVGQVRTWNLMIDVVAQTGHFPPNATGFNNFLVTAEQRYWAHVAIDRYTGQVVSIQLEPVSE